MQDNCAPPAAAAQPRHHRPGQVLGRIRRHGTRRIARQLGAEQGKCLAAPISLLGTRALKMAAPMLVFAGLAYAAPAVLRAGPAPQSTAPADPGIGLADGFSALKPTITLGHGPHRRVLTVPEPASVTLLGAGTAWLALRRRFSRD